MKKLKGLLEMVFGALWVIVCCALIIVGVTMVVIFGLLTTLFVAITTFENPKDLYEELIDFIIKTFSGDGLKD